MLMQREAMASSNTNLAARSASMPHQAGKDVVRAVLDNLLNNIGAEHLATLAQDLKIRPEELASSGPAHFTTCVKREVPPHIGHISREIVTRNNKSLKAFSLDLPPIGMLLPELERKSPAEALQALSDRFDKDPSPGNSKLLQYAVNRITSVGEVDSHMKSEIEKATSVLHKESETKPGSTDDLWVYAYVDPYFRGAQLFQELVPGWVYYRVPNLLSFNDKISSLTLGCSRDEFIGEVILFSDPHFNGRYKMFSVAPESSGTGGTTNVEYVGDDFNDITSSLLLVRRFAHEFGPLPFVNMVSEKAITGVITTQPDFLLNGRVTYSWDMWPYGQPGHPNEPDKTYIYINVPIVFVYLFASYYCEVHYWIYTFVDDGGAVQGYVDYYGCWVEDNLRDISNALMLRIPSTLGQMDSLVADAMDLVNSIGPFNTVYLLPGYRGLEEAGNVTDGVQVVITKR
jgi:hypothetical protein